MKTIGKVFGVSCLLVTVAAWCQPVCPVDPVDRCSRGECVCSKGSRLAGDPVMVMGGSRTSHFVRDLQIDTGFGKFELWRYYGSSQSSSLPSAINGGVWPPYLSIPPSTNQNQGPFGTSQTNASGQGNPVWSYDLFSFVDLTSYEAHSVAQVYDGTLGWYEFAKDESIGVPCNGSRCGFLPHTGNAPATPARLERQANGAGFQYRFIRRDGEQWIYAAPNQATTPTVYYLSEVRNRSGQSLYTVQYAHQVVGAVDCGGATSGAVGAPFISTVTFAADPLGTGAWLEFVYGLSGASPLNQCVLTGIKWHPKPAAAGVPVANYGYSASSGFLASGGPAGDEESYEYTYSSAAGFVVKASGGRIKVAQSYATLMSVSSLSGQGNEPDLALSAGLAPNYTDACIMSPQPAYLTTSDQTGGGGSPSIPAVKLTSAYLGYRDYTYGEHALGFASRTDSCSPAPPLIVAGFCSSGSVAEQHDGVSTPGAACQPTLNTGASLYKKDKRNFWSGLLKQRSPTETDDFYPTFRKEGISTVGGSDSLQTVTLNSTLSGSYLNHARITDLVERPGNLGAFTTSTQEAFDATGFRTSISTYGQTALLNGTPQSKHVFTNFLKTRQCVSPAPTTDAVGRVLRIEGPCSSSTCTGTFPITEFVYYDTSVVPAGNRLGRLKSVTRFPNGSCLGGLTTTYQDYTAEGMPTAIVDESNITTTYTYDSVHRTKIATKSVNGAAPTQYSYEPDGALRSIQYPEGNFEVFCHYGLATAAPPCVFPPTTPASQENPRVVWKAKVASASATTFSEKVEYAYTSDGLPFSETYRDSTGGVRYIHTIYSDVHGRATWDGVGSTAGGTDGFSSKRSFDAADNLDALGNSSTGAPDFCRTGGTPTGAHDTLCAWMTYDRANRLTQVAVNPDVTTSLKNCLDYDANGNVRRVLPGAATGDTCAGASGGSSSGATSSSTVAPPTDYDVDDFGNVTRVRLAGPQSASVTATNNETHYEYDLRGNVIKKQTKTMAASNSWLEFTYDQLNRLTLVSSMTGAVPTLLYALYYDSPYTLCSTNANTGGRLSLRVDSFGWTSYNYDPDGRILNEYRSRDGGCSTLNNNPSTTYTYSSNGNLKAITYPYGRKVTYLYGTGGLTDRVSGATVSMFLAGIWQTKPALTLIQSVEWEPYGGLRAYKYLTATQTNMVEYSRHGPTATLWHGGDSTCIGGRALETTAPDGTGRTRALWVSSGNPPLGGGTGDVMSQHYTWNGDQLADEQTCFTALSQTTEHRQQYTYDTSERLKLASGSNMPVRTTGTGSGSYSRTYGYDRRGNRTSSTIDGCPRTASMGAFSTSASSPVDELLATAPDASASCGGGFSGYTNLYDNDGRVSRKGTAWWWWYMDFGFLNTGNNINPAVGSGGLDSVYKSLVVTGGTSPIDGPNYQYYYDAYNRRRIKQFPVAGTQEEYFYDLGHQMLTSVGSNHLSSPDRWMVDDYVWLDGRAIAMIRGSWSTAWAHNQNDDQASCTRMDEAGKCGLFHIINDYLPKPVLMVQSSTGSVVNAALYDEFGDVNRAPLVAKATVPSSGTLTVGSTSNPAGGNVDARVLYNFLDVPPGTLVTLQGLTPSSTSLVQKAHVWSGWVPMGTGASSTVVLASGTSAGYQGVQTEVMEYRRYSSGATPMWVPFRFPGQFYDPETQLFENWNRYYDPSTGRYLSVEPLLNNAALVALDARSGRISEAYSYSANNPIVFSDDDGLRLKPERSCDKSIQDLVSKLETSASKTKKCRCKDLLEDNKIIEKILTKAYTISIACHAGYIPKQGTACGHGERMDIDLSTRSDCSCPAKKLLDEILHTDPESIIHNADNKPVHDSSFAVFDAVEDCISCDGTIVQ